MINVSYCPNHALMMEEMSEVHTFRNKFTEEKQEVIWGVAEDMSLGEKVKITILATGFGVENVPGMESVLSKRKNEEEEQRVKNEEVNERNKQRIKMAYGTSAESLGNKKRVKRNNIYIFNTEDLDNDDIISDIDNSPTFFRDRTKLNAIKEKAKQEEVTTSETIVSDGVIHF